MFKPSAVTESFNSIFLNSCITNILYELVALWTVLQVTVCCEILCSECNNYNYNQQVLVFVCRKIGLSMARFSMIIHRVYFSKSCQLIWHMRFRESCIKVILTTNIWPRLKIILANEHMLSLSEALLMTQLLLETKCVCVDHMNKIYSHVSDVALYTHIKILVLWLPITLRIIEQ